MPAGRIAVVDAAGVAALRRGRRRDRGRAEPGLRPMRRPADLPRGPRRRPARRPATAGRCSPGRRRGRCARGARGREPRRPAGAAWSSSAPIDSEAITRKAWDQLVARNRDLLASKSLYVERTTANARVFYRLRVAGFDEHRPDARDVRGAARARRRLHPGDAAVDGGPRRHLRLRRAGPRRRPSGASSPRRTPGASSSSRATSRRPAQLRRLTADLRDSVGRDAPVLIDQEGGRVARMRAPVLARVAAGARRMRAAAGPSAARPGDAPALPADRGRTRRGRHRRRTARRCSTSCSPRPMRSSATAPTARTRPRSRAIGRAVAEGLLAGGVLPVMKHMPGQGRATLDSHLDLPRVDGRRAPRSTADFAPFRALADLPMAMTGACGLRGARPGRRRRRSRRAVIAADPRGDRLRRAADDRRSVDAARWAAASTRAPRARSPPACDMRPPLQRRRRRRRRPSPRRRRGSTGRAAARADAALALRGRRAAERRPAALEAEFAALGRAAHA